VVGEGAFCVTSVSGSSAFATTDGSGRAFTVGCLDLTAFGPEVAFFNAFEGEGAGEVGISVRGKLDAACCEARSRPDEDASCRSRLRSSLIALFAGVPFLPHAATTTADIATANIEDLRTVRTCASK
jgi:hypothetical protein